MSSIPAFDWTRRLDDDWTSPEGLSNLKSLVQPRLSFEPHDWQAYDSACILNGRDVFCISATGDGKSALIYIPALVRKGMITVVVEPTNALENNMIASLRSKGLASIVINAEEIEDAKKKNKDRNLWQEAKDCRYRVIALSPEMLQSGEFSTLIQDASFRKRWGVLAVDEAHLVDDWGTEFRKAYAAIWTLRARGPDHLSLVAMSASVEKGPQMTRILQRLGYREDAYHLDKRDCQRHNVDYVFRTMQFSHTGFEFRDLDWLIPTDLAHASDVPKRILYSDTIEMGHRIAGYLRALLPIHLQKFGYSLVRHMHSMNCPECKKEGLAALEASDEDRTTAIFVATAVWEVGLDVPDIDSVILYPAPASASSIIQRAGRPARSPGMRGEAIVYVKKADSQAALEYAKREPADSRLLDPENVLPREHIPSESRSDGCLLGMPLVSAVDTDIEMREHDGDERTTPNTVVVGRMSPPHDDESSQLMRPEGRSSLRNAPVQQEPGQVHSQVVSSAARTLDDTGLLDEGHVEVNNTCRQPVKVVKQKAGPSRDKGDGTVKKVGRKKTAADLPHSEQSKQLCSARLLIIAAHTRGLCITRQINLVYDNPGTDHNCGRCSSCLPRPLPIPRPMPSPIIDTPEASIPTRDSDTQPMPTLPAYMKLTSAELVDVSQELSVIGRRLWRKVLRGPECLFIGPTSFLRPDIVKRVTTDFHLLSSMEDLEHRLQDDWCYWPRAGTELWSEVAGLAERFREKAMARHERSLEVRREARGRKEADAVRADLVSKGLDHIKRVKLRVPTLISSLDRAAASESSAGITEPTISASVPAPPSCSSVNRRATTPEPGPVRLAPAILSPSNRAVQSSSSSSPAEHVAGASIPVEQFYGTTANPRKHARMQDLSHVQDERPAKAQKMVPARKTPRAAASHKENSAATSALRRSKRGTKA